MENSITCLDCGISQSGIGQPKEVARKFNWVYVTKGKWRCPDCQAFQNGMMEQFGAEAEMIIPSRG